MKQMTKRENMLKAIRFERPDTIPMGFHINAACWHHYDQNALQDLVTGAEQLAFGIPRSRATPFYDKLADWELAWCQAEHDIPAAAQGDTLEIAREILGKYGTQLAKPLPPFFEHGEQTGKALESGL